MGLPSAQLIRSGNLCQSERYINHRFQVTKTHLRGTRWASIALLFSCFSLAAPAAASQPRVTLAENEGFCPNGVYSSTTWPKNIVKLSNVWGSYCNAGDQTLGKAVTTPFPAPKILSLYLAGYPSWPGISVWIENVVDGTKFFLKPSNNPREEWRKFDFSVPLSLVSKPIRLVAEDRSTAPGGWIAFSEPVAATPAWDLSDARVLLGKALLSDVITFLPCLAVCGFFILRGTRNVCFLGLVALSTTGAVGYFSFWIWFLSPRLGRRLSLWLPILFIAALLFAIRRMDKTGRVLLKALLMPISLTATVALMVLAAGFLYGGLSDPLETAWTRFSHPLPPDNTIPYLFAEGIARGHVPKPLIADWESSDRPPLQTGLVLSEFAYLRTEQNYPRSELNYMVVADLLQSLWVIGLWALLISFELDKRAVALTSSVCVFSGFVFLNSFYVWPKLLAAAYTLGLFAILLGGRFGVTRLEATALSVLAGALAAFGLLAHGGTMFALLALGFTILILRVRVSLRSLAISALTLGTLYLPWLLYQTYYDPPGDRLLKYHLAGVEPITKSAFLPVLAAAYKSLSLGQILHNKFANIMTVAGHGWEYWRQVSALIGLLPGANHKSTLIAATASALRAQDFFYFVPNLGFLVLGIPALIFVLRRRSRSPEHKVALSMWLFVALTAVCWCLLMFKPESALLHQGTYVMVLLAYAGSTLALWAVSRSLAVIVAALQIALQFLLYGFTMRIPLTNALPEGTVRLATLMLGLLSAAAFFILVARCEESC